MRRAGAKATSFNIEETLLENFRDEARKRRTTLTAAISEAILTWISGGNVEARTSAEISPARKPFGTKGIPDNVIQSTNRVTLIPEEYEPWVSQLLHILREKNSYACPSIKKNIQAFVRLTDLDGGAHGPPPGEETENDFDRILKDGAKVRSDAAASIAKKHQGKRGGRREAS